MCQPAILYQIWPVYAIFQLLQSKLFISAIFSLLGIYFLPVQAIFSQNKRLPFGSLGETRQQISV